MLAGAPRSRDVYIRGGPLKGDLDHMKEAVARERPGRDGTPTAVLCQEFKDDYLDPESTPIGWLASTRTSLVDGSLPREQRMLRKTCSEIIHKYLLQTLGNDHALMSPTTLYKCADEEYSYMESQTCFCGHCSKSCKLFTELGKATFFLETAMLQRVAGNFADLATTAVEKPKETGSVKLADGCMGIRCLSPPGRRAGGERAGSACNGTPSPPHDVAFTLQRPPTAAAPAGSAAAAGGREGGRPRRSCSRPGWRGRQAGRRRGRRRRYVFLSLKI